VAIRTAIIKTSNANDETITITSIGLTNLKVNQSVDGSILFSLTNGLYSNSIIASNFTISNLPSGLTAGMALRTSDTEVRVPITGSPIAANTNNITIILPTNIQGNSIAGGMCSLVPIGTITINEISKGDGANVTIPTQQTVSHNRITVNTVTISGTNPGSQTVQYAINTSTVTLPTVWQTSTEFTGLNASTTYYVWARSIENANYNAGTAQRSSAITTLEIINAATPTISTQPQSASYGQRVAARALSVTATRSDVGTLSYQWYRNTANSNTSGTMISGATQSTYTPSTTTIGTTYYYVVVTNTNNSVNGTQTASVTSSTATITVNVVTSAPELTAAATFKLYPNPATTELRLESEDITSGDVIRIYTTSGQLVDTYIAEGSQITINVSHLPVGTYVITVGESVQIFVKE
jgi:hypothetical protein